MTKFCEWLVHKKCLISELNSGSAREGAVPRWNSSCPGRRLGRAVVISFWWW